MPSRLTPPESEATLNYRPKKNTAWRTVAGETIVIDLETKVMFGLNETGAFLWRATETVESVEDLAQLFTSDSPETIDTTTIEEFFAELTKLGLLLPREPSELRSVGNEPEELSLPEDLSPPAVLWEEALERIAASCAFLPAQSPLCTQVPMA